MEDVQKLSKKDQVNNISVRVQHPQFLNK